MVSLLDGNKVPLLVIGLLRKPEVDHPHFWLFRAKEGYSDHYEKYCPQTDLDALKRLSRDVEEFPLELFYETLLNLRGIQIKASDHMNAALGIARREEKDIVIDVNKLKEYMYLGNFSLTMYAHLLVHELYHHVEWALEDRIANLFEDNPRWDVTKGRRGWRCPTIHYVKWGDADYFFNEDNFYHPQFAELLTALTMAKHPEIEGVLFPQVNYLRELAEGQGYLFKNKAFNNGDLKI